MNTSLALDIWTEALIHEYFGNGKMFDYLFGQMRWKTFENRFKTRKKNDENSILVWKNQHIFFTVIFPKCFVFESVSHSRSENERQRLRSFTLTKKKTYARRIILIRLNTRIFASVVFLLVLISIKAYWFMYV